MNKKIVMISANTAWNLYSRKRLLLAFRQAGWEVIALAATDSCAEKIEKELGIHFIPLPMKGDSTKILEDFRLLLLYIRLYRSIRPLAAFHINNKPNIYGSIAASFAGINSAANITGLGIVAEKKGLTRFLVYTLYRFAFFSRKTFVFFQNQDDRRFFIDNGLVKEPRTGLLPGSGVDITVFTPESDAENLVRAKKQGVRFLYNSRLLLTKGIREYIAAARKIRLLYPDTVFTIIGEYEAGNSIFLPADELESAVKEGIIEYSGVVADVKSYIRNSDCVVLPSWYREGVPRALLEAAAMGKPLIVADSIGTREPVEDGINGYLVKSADPAALAKALIDFIQCPDETKKKMGAESRRIAVKQFSDSIVIDTYLQRLSLIEKTSAGKEYT